MTDRRGGGNHPSQPLLYPDSFIVSRGCMKLVLIVSAVVVLSLIMGLLFCGAVAKFSEAFYVWLSGDDDDRDNM